MIRMPKPGEFNPWLKNRPKSKTQAINKILEFLTSKKS